MLLPINNSPPPAAPSVSAPLAYVPGTDAAYDLVTDLNWAGLSTGGYAPKWGIWRMTRYEMAFAALKSLEDFERRAADQSLGQLDSRHRLLTSLRRLALQFEGEMALLGIDGVELRGRLGELRINLIERYSDSGAFRNTSGRFSPPQGGWSNLKLSGRGIALPMTAADTPFSDVAFWGPPFPNRSAPQPIREPTPWLSLPKRLLPSSRDVLLIPGPADLTVTRKGPELRVKDLRRSP